MQTGAAVGIPWDNATGMYKVLFALVGALFPHAIMRPQGGTSVI